MSATPRATTPSSRCSAISRSATISRSARSSLPGSSSPRNSGCRRTGCWSPSMSTTTRPSTCGRRSPGCPTSKIIRIAGADNFWAMGDTGPCGPCSEIFYDHGDAHSRRAARLARRRRRPLHRDLESRVHAVRAAARAASASTLPRPSIDTGMGLERIAAVLQGTHDNYDIDLFRALIRAIADLTKVDRRRAAQGLAPRHRRPSARLVLPDRRRRAAVERGPRLRASPHHAPRHAPRRTARRAETR